MPPSTGEEDRVLDGLSGYLGEVAGLELSGSQRLRLELAVRERVQECGVRSVAEYGAQVRSDEVEFHQLLDRVVTGETYFFRIPSHFELLRRQVVPELLRTTPTVRILCAACATGEEPYSIAMAMPELISQGRVEIQAGDISETALDRARAATYDRFSFRMAGIEAFALELSRWFTDRGGRRQLDDQIRRSVRFAPMNLLTLGDEGPFRGPYHVVFCRNVFIYFNLPTVRQVVERLGRLTTEAGTLFLGDAESLLGVSQVFESETIGGSIIYRKARAAVVTKPPRTGRPVAAPIAPGMAARPPGVPAGGPVTSRPGPFERGRQAEARHDRTTAVRDYQEAIRASDRTFEARLALARIHADEGRADEAITQAESALKLNPLQTEAHLWIGLVQQSRNDHAAAARAFRRALYCDPDHCVAHFFLSLTLSELGDVAGARASRRQALRLAESPTAARHSFPGYTADFVRDHCRLLGNISEGEGAE